MGATPQLRDFMLDQKTVHAIRKAVFHSKSPGYFIFRNFIPKELVEHVQNYWTKAVNPRDSHKPFLGKGRIALNCPNFYGHYGTGGKNQVYYNFFWNPPADEVTHTIAHYVYMIRNQAQGFPLYHGITNSTQETGTYRVVISKHGKKIVGMHRDWSGDRKTDPFDPSRMQATLFLSEHGKDYTGKGFLMRNNQGKLINLAKKEKLKPGDLVLWRYINEHGVLDVDSGDKDIGFMRMIFPSGEKLNNRYLVSPKEVKNWAMYHVSTNPYFGKQLKKIYWKVRGGNEKI